MSISNPKGIEHLGSKEIYEKVSPATAGGFFGVYQKPTFEKPTELKFVNAQSIDEFFKAKGPVGVDPNKTYPATKVLDGSVTTETLKAFDELSQAQHLGLFGDALAVLNSKKAFDGISKEVFSKEVVQFVERSECAGGYAFLALARKVGELRQAKAASQDSEHDLKHMGLFADFIYDLHDKRSGNLISAAEFHHGIFEDAPLSVAEIKAIPFLVGVAPELYEKAGVDYSQHAKSVAKKLEIAGLTLEANIVTDLSVERSMKARKTEEPSGPSL